MRSTKALRRRGPGGRLIAAPTVGTGVWWRCRGRCLHRPEPAAGGSHCRRRGLVLPPAGHFSPRKSAENAPGAAAPGLPLGLRGVHPRERHCASSCCPPSRPVPYCPPLPGFARASGIGWLLQLQNFSQRPHPLPRNRGSDCTRQFFRAISGSAVGARIARPLGCDVRVPPSNVPGNNFPVGADAFIGPRRVSGLTRRVRRLRKTGYTVAPPASPALCATSPQGEAWAGVFGGGAFAVQASGPMWASAPTRERRQRSGFDKMDKIPLAH